MKKVSTKKLNNRKFLATRVEKKTTKAMIGIL
jgi:hypothetical protein